MTHSILTPAAHKHGAAAGDAGRPASADWSVDQAWHRYGDAEHAVWRTLYERQTTLLQGRACDAWLQGLQALPITSDRIPRFDDLSETLMRRTGWQLVAVPGLVPDEVFFQHLAARRFPCGHFIRGAHELDYLEEPDVFHDVFGHVPMLMNPVLADFLQAYGEGGLRAQRLGRLKQLGRLYWFTVEFGLVQQDQGLRLWGAGIVSSAAESRFALDSSSPHRLGFDLERVMRTRHRIDDLQPTYFVLRSLDQLLDLARVDFGPLYERLADGPEHEVGQVLDSDTVFQHGDGHHHRPRAAP